MDALAIRMEIKRLLKEAREKYPTFEFIGEVDEDDVAIEALIRTDLYETMIRLKEGKG